MESCGWIRSFVSRDLLLEFIRLLHKYPLLPDFMSGREKMVRGEKEKPRIRAVKVDSLLDIRKIS